MKPKNRRSVGSGRALDPIQRLTGEPSKEGELSFIQDDHIAIHGPLKKWVAHHSWREDLNLPVVTVAGLIDKPKIPIWHRFRAGIGELGEQIDIALIGIIAPSHGPKNAEAFHAEALAEFRRIARDLLPKVHCHRNGIDWVNRGLQTEA